jgi:hypothetical protein
LREICAWTASTSSMSAGGLMHATKYTAAANRHTSKS